MSAASVVRASTRATFASMAHPNYRRYVSGQIVSLTGTWMQTVAQSWLVLELTGSGTAVGVVVALQTLPILVLAPYGGVVADRVDKRRFLIFLQCMMGVLALVLAVLTLRGIVEVWHVAVIALLLGLCSSFENPTRQSFILEMVGPAHLRNAVSLNSVMVNVARAVGPAIAGVVIAAGGTGICFLLNALSFLPVIFSLTTLDQGRLQPSPAATRAPRQLREGLTYVRRNPELAVPLLMMALVGCLSFEFQVVLPVVASETFSGGPKAYGLLTAAMGAGAVVGGLVVAARGRTGGRALVVASLAFAVTLLAAAAAPTLGVALAAMAVVGAVSSAFQSTGNSTLQLAASASMRGRVMALGAVAFLGSTTIGGPIAGVVTDHFGGRGGLVLGGLAALLAAGMGALLLRRATAATSPGAPWPCASAPNRPGRWRNRHGSRGGHHTAGRRGEDHIHHSVGRRPGCGWLGASSQPDTVLRTRRVG